MKVDLIKDKDANEIKQIWEEFHKLKECTISATLPADKFSLFKEKSKKHPLVRKSIICIVLNFAYLILSSFISVLVPASTTTRPGLRIYYVTV